MSTLTRIFHFHEGSPTERAVKIGASFLATLALVITAGAMSRITATEHAPGAPAIRDITVTTGPDFAIISWTTDISAMGGVVWGTEPQSARIAAGETPSHVALAYPETPAAGSRIVTLTGLTPDTAYSYFITETTGTRDAYGNELRTESAERVFHTDPLP